jgi:hypothetical protein
MPDTGAPWNLPYPSPSDLVRDAPQAFEDLAEAVADGLDNAGSEGIGPNVVQTVKTDVFTASLAQGVLSGDVTGLTASITPSSDTQKVLVMADISVFSGAEAVVTLFRDGSAIYIADASGSRQRATAGAGGQARTPASVAITFLDDPLSAVAVTYSLRLSHTGSVTTIVGVNRSLNDANETRVANGVSSITLIEVKV